MKIIRGESPAIDAAIEDAFPGARLSFEFGQGQVALGLRFADLPQVLPNFMSYTLLRIEINVRASTIIGAVGGGGIGEELKLSISRGFGAKTLALVLLLFTTIFLIDQFSAWLRRKLVGEQAFATGA